MQAMHDLKLPVIGHPERAVFACLQRTYGVADAGRIVKWAFWKYDGKPDGKPITYNSFMKAKKWQTDKWYIELQQHEKREQKSSGSEGFASLKDL
jgi:hypothetical protein